MHHHPTIITLGVAALLLMLPSWVSAIRCYKGWPGHLLEDDNCKGGDINNICMTIGNVSLCGFTSQCRGGREGCGTYDKNRQVCCCTTNFCNDGGKTGAGDEQKSTINCRQGLAHLSSIKACDAGKKSCLSFFGTAAGRPVNMWGCGCPEPDLDGCRPVDETGRSGKICCCHTDACNNDNGGQQVVHSPRQTTLAASAVATVHPTSSLVIFAVSATLLCGVFLIHFYH